MLDELNLGKILVLALYSLPGFIFIFTYARYCIPGGRLYAGRTVQFFSAVICSSFIFLLFDLMPVKNSASRLLEKIPDKYHLNTWSEQVKRESLLSTTIDYLLRTDTHETSTVEKNRPKPTKDKNQNVTASDALPDNLSQTEGKKKFLFYLIKSTIFLVAPFSWFLAAVIAFFYSILNHFLLANPVVYFWRFGLLSEWIICSILGLLRKAFPPYFHVKVSTLFTNIFSTLPKRIVEPVLRLVTYIAIVLAVALVFVVIAGTFVWALALLPFELLMYVYYRVLVLLTPPVQDAFFSFKARLAITIVEVRTKEGILVKGRYVGVDPNKDGSLGAITITNVVQYSRKYSEKSFSRNNREIYVFPHFDSRLLIPSESISDVNTWRLPTDGFKADFHISNEDQLENQLWYLKLYLHSHKAVFSFPKSWSFSIDAEYGPIFCCKLLEVFDEVYLPKQAILPFFYRKKLRRLLKKFSPIMKGYLHASRKGSGRASLAHEKKQALQVFRRLVIATR